MGKPYRYIIQVFVFTSGIALVGVLAQCAPFTEHAQQSQSEPGFLVVGHARAVLIGPTNRHYEPRVRLIEVVQQRTNRRVEIEPESDGALFVAQLPDGDYVLARVQINEGPFLAMAHLDARFTVQAGGVTYLGTLQFGVDPPKYDRMVVLAVTEDPADRAAAEREFAARYPAQTDPAFSPAPLTPPALQARLYEVSPYPRVQPYFRRHWW